MHINNHAPCAYRVDQPALKMSPPKGSLIKDTITALAVSALSMLAAALSAPISPPLAAGLMCVPVLAGFIWLIRRFGGGNGGGVIHHRVPHQRPADVHVYHQPVPMPTQVVHHHTGPTPMPVYQTQPTRGPSAYIPPPQRDNLQPLPTHRGPVPVPTQVMHHHAAPTPMPVYQSQPPRGPSAYVPPPQRDNLQTLPTHRGPGGPVPV